MVDNFLADEKRHINGQSVVETVANTIFPEQLWRLSGGDRSLFFKKYRRNMAYMMRHRNNVRGIYFQRMVAFNGDNGAKINQLEHVIETWEKENFRHSALQAAVFDPRVDHSHQRRLGFPCLQQVAFHPSGTKGSGGLSIVAFYATQTLTEKAYGNYLGLYRLGRFMSEQMGLEFKEVICMASDMKINDSKNKSKSQPLVDAIKQEVVNAGQ